MHKPKNFLYVAGSAFVWCVIGVPIVIVLANVFLSGTLAVFSYGWHIGLLIVGLIIGFFWWESRKKDKAAVALREEAKIKYETTGNVTLNAPCGIEEARRRIQEWEKKNKWWQK